MIIKFRVLRGIEMNKTLRQDSGAYLKASIIKALGKVYNIQEASKRLKVPIDNIRLMVKRGIIGHIQFDDEIIIPRIEIDEFLRANKRNSEIVGIEKT